MTSVNRRDVQKILGTIEIICRSPSVERYLVGLTIKSALVKGAGYARAEFEHFVVLADKLTCASAINLEGELFNKIKESDQRGVIYQKYEPRRIRRHYHPSCGGLSTPADDRSYSVYMAFWEREK